VIAWLLGGPLGGEGQLLWSAPVWLIAAAAVAILAGWGLALRGGPPGARGLRVAEALAWALALLALGAGLAGPRWVEGAGREEPARYLVLVDQSASMGVREGGVSRGERARALVDAVRAEVGEPVDVFSFDEQLRPGEPAAFDGRGTDLGLALAALSDRHLGVALRGVAVITDGADRGGLRASLSAAAGGQDPAAVGAVPPLPGPLTVLAVGAPQALTDTAVDEVYSGGFAFLRTPLVLRARLRGAPGAAVPVRLSRDGQVIDEQQVRFDEAGLAEARFTITPREVGRFAWEVSTPVDPRDAVPGNNTLPVVLRVVRDRTRVLQVSGSPSYDQKFLRLFLKEDPSVDLVSFFILRTHEDMGSPWRPHEMSLIEFPYERLFTEELESFDLVILQNFNHGPYFTYASDQLLGNLAEYVEAGGALAMTGGDRSFDLGEYQGTPLEPVLPVKLGLSGPKVEEDPFRPELTAAGQAHPLARLGASEAETAEVWSRLPLLDGANRSRGLAPGAAALLTHPTARAEDGSPLPILAVRELGEGRTMALAVDASWRWSFSEAAEGRGNQAYLRFWKNSLRWLVADPEDRRVVVTPSRENVLRGDEVRVVVRVRDAAYAPVPGAAVTLVVQGPGGESTAVDLLTSADGSVEHPVRPEAQGAWRVEAQAGPLAADRARSVFAVSDRDPELIDVVPDPAFLERLAAAYGDRARFIPDGDSPRPLVNPEARRSVSAQRETSLASSPLIALVFGLSATVAWGLRRRRGAR
jgi:uncharacterized membrane protein